jgi:hypothetical protein
MVSLRGARAVQRQWLRIEIRAKRHPPAIGGHEQTFFSDEKDLAPEIIADLEFCQLLSCFHRPDDRRKQVCRREHRSASVEDELTRRRV